MALVLIPLILGAIAWHVFCSIKVDGKGSSFGEQRGEAMGTGIDHENSKRGRYYRKALEVLVTAGVEAVADQAIPESTTTNSPGPT